MVLRNKIKLIALTGFILFAEFANAQNDKPFMSSGDLQFYLDKAVFSGKEGKQYVEFYFMFFSDKINFTKNKKGEINITMNINDESGRKVSSREWTLEVSLSEDETGIKTKVFYDQVNEYLAPGKFKIMVTAYEVNNNLSGKITGVTEIMSVRNDKLSASEIEFVSSIDNNSGPVHFRKGSKYITANPSRRYGILNPVLYFYYEIYNIVPDTGKTLNINYTISALSTDQTKNFPAVILKKNNTTLGITHGLNAGNLPSGIYNLNINVNDLDRNESLDITRSFEIIQMDYAGKKPAIGLEDSEIFEKILSIIGTDSQLKNYKMLSTNGKAAYIIEYWKNVDPSPGTPENEYLSTIQQRFLYANKNFGWGKTEGWQSERGRVLIKYGNPDEIEQHHSEAGTYPYEIWIYQQVRKYIFVFGDLTNNGRYVLLHSDKEGEISNDRWKDYLQ